MALEEIHDGWRPQRIDEAPIEATLAVIRSVGIVDPVLLRPAGDHYEVVTGHRTVAAARLAGMERVPAVVKVLDDAQALTALALDGSATGLVTADAAEELRARLRAAGVETDDADDVMAAMPVAAHTGAAAPPEAVAEPEAATPPASSAVSPPAVPAGRWVPLPSGTPRLARLSTAFADAPRMLDLLASDGFTGTVELVGLDGRRDAVTLLAGQCVAVSVEEGGRRVTLPLRLPAPEQGPVVEITVRPHPPTVVVALALALRSPARLVGLHASFLDFDGLLRTLNHTGRDAAVVVSAPRSAGIILLSGGEPIAAYARREGEQTGEAAETNDLAAVTGLLADGEGEIDVHDGPLVEPIDLQELIAGATTGA